MAGFDELGLLLGIVSVEQAELMFEVRNNRWQARDCFNLPDEKFVKLFRLNKRMTGELIDRLSPYMVQPNRTSALNVESKVLAALRFFASGSYQLNIAEDRNISISQSSVSRSVHEVIDAVHESNFFHEMVQFPAKIEEVNRIREKFYAIYNFPGIVGCIDCTHVAIVAPPKDDRLYPEHIYVNRKGYHSVNVQLICDSDLKILHVNARFPGATHDSFIWRNCNVLPIMQQLHRRYPGQYFLLGDSGYALRPWMMTPINNPVGDGEENFNSCQMSARSSVERVNGVLKSRFRCLLKHRVLHYAPNIASKIINTCCALHNMCIANNLPNIDDDEDYDDDEPLNHPEAPVENYNDLLEGRRIRNNIIRNHFSI